MSSVWSFILAHVVPVVLGGGAGYLLGGRRRAVADAADTATDQAVDAALKNVKK